MAMKGMLQGLDASGHAIPGAAPSAAMTVLAASLRHLLPPELVIMVDAMLCSWPQYPCPCPVNPTLDKDVRVSLQVGLILEFHGRDPQRLSDFPMFFQWLLAWFSMSVNPDPNNYRTALAELLAVDPPNVHWLYTDKDVVMVHGLIIGLYDTILAGRSPDFETEAVFRHLPARPATPILHPPVVLPLHPSVPLAGLPASTQPAPFSAPPRRALSASRPSQAPYADRDPHLTRSSRDYDSRDYSRNHHDSRDPANYRHDRFDNRDSTRFRLDHSSD